MSATAHVVFVPGMARPATDADPFFRHLPTGWRTTAVARSVSDEPFSVGDALADILSPARHGDNPVVLVGHSFGGYLAELAYYQLLSSQPERKVALVLLDASVADVPRPWLNPGTLWRWWRPLMTVAPHPVEHFLHENSAFRATAKVVRAARDTWREPLLTGGPDGSRVVVTARWINNRLTRALPWSWFTKQARLARGLGARHLVVSPSGHHVMLQHPKEVAEIVAATLR
ncbi:MAG TPA: alpha/beta fold hydrolase [Candidatus Corynebacterium gallistercoris]|uniref:Alpha/beta fold hydrolase n=1 Tax=Candidatus Corynebacterium gallistercoris TaxID=2838530 RepID=A0A9D1UPI2_9CORY|nr:alpha/beta fold hydrolase [Candidatus Corynebacterium gallistercoris]